MRRLLHLRKCCVPIATFRNNLEVACRHHKWHVATFSNNLESVKFNHLLIELNSYHLPFHLCSSTASSSTVTLVVSFLDLNILLTCLTSSLTTWHFMYMFNWLSFDLCPMKIKSFMIDCMTCFSCVESWTVRRYICLASTCLIAAHLHVYMHAWHLLLHALPSFYLF